MAPPRKPNPLSREEDYRDYEDREIRDGWPYSDVDGNPLESRPHNTPYGDTPANFDEDPSTGFTVDTADGSGREHRVDTAAPLPASRIDDDELEAEITELLEESGKVVTDNIEVHSLDGIITLEGRVETISLARKLEEIVLTVPGVVGVHNNLETLGVDSHMPDEE
ncbi:MULTISPECIES: BON domain-containing protein [Rhizobium]|uniref:BON domain-containing protein n=1 Tax=Rhizobium tropici TaxID=398 RepID=A0A6P1C4C2_RHITR|nr:MULTISPECIES: BON domain-containing protein [Rhizobium]AGB75049.1 hypothetical protein RTCIAT899_PC06285 [Rhizobium tropici CIAT 899]MBB4243006.1 hypothetical protein [Rhizobium tropici]MBB5594579.1 hypothetical protein [Rhizobium tropici]MBB6493332.1 hypothetical protein [Rhizobium tropici]NEV11537.1 BON domain-containing protein [Rhizobium tropici]